MVAGALLPVALYNNKLYFLFGKENPMEDSSNGWSDFGGGCENKETPYQTALREGGEELTGLGDGNALEKRIQKSGGVHKVSMGDYHTHLFPIEYDENLPVYYNYNHEFLWKRMDKHMLNKSKLFEKIEIRWFTEKELRTQKSKFRDFYQKMVENIIADLPAIRQFIRSKKGRITRYSHRGGCASKVRKTRKMRGG
jgi:8-oxo-dGTP pyrophosphatase MutT (NUDIX family)